MSTGRPSLGFIAAILTASIASLVAPPVAQAGCFDWLCGRPSATYTANYPSAYVSPVPQATGTGPVAVPTAPANPGVMNSGVVQAQRPAYGAPIYTTPVVTSGATVPVQTFQNPSVYTGMPVNQLPQNQIPPNTTTVQRLPITTPAPTAYASPPTAYAPTTTTYRLPLTTTNQVPIASTLRGNTTGYPITTSPAYTSYSPSDVAPVTYNAPPSTQALPLAPRTKSGCGLCRFFNSCLGRSNTSYTTSYYRAPITYYRPMTTVNPVTGTTVTVQQPCTSYVQQLQRVPSNTLLPTQGVTPAPSACPPPSSLGACPVPMSSTPGSFAPPPSSVGQVGGLVAPEDYGVAPIPSTVPDAGYPNTAPLTGSSPGVSGNGGGNPDLQAIPKPELEAGRPATESPSQSNRESANKAPTESDDTEQDDIYPYGGSGSAAEDSNGSNEPEGPAIKLDPPVTRNFPGSNPSGRFIPQQQYTTQTPPSLQSMNTGQSGSAQSGSGPAPGYQQYSTLRPIGVPAESSDSTSNLNAVQNAGGQDKPRLELEAPPLPAPRNRAADPSALFRHSESSASVRQPVQTRVTVPIREATTRNNSVRQVAAWNEITPRTTVAPKPVVKRDNSGWMPAR